MVPTTRVKKTVLGSIIVFGILAVTVGSFAWSSYKQSSLSVFEGFANPNVNLHDDFRKPIKNVFVENSGEEPLYIRVALDEYMKIGQSVVESITGKQQFVGVDGENGWLIHNFEIDAGNCGEDFHNYYNWVLGGSGEDAQKKYKHFLTAPFASRARFDENGNQTAFPKTVTANANDQPLFGVNHAYDTVTMDKAYELLEERLSGEYSATMSVKEYIESLYAKIDTANNSLASEAKVELNSYIENPINGLGYYDKVFNVDNSGAVTSSFVIKWTPIKRTLKTTNVYTMVEWIAEGRPIGDFWVIDFDGWCYWGNKLLPNTATGLLLSEVNQSNTEKPSQKWSYKISSTLQAVTHDDIEKLEMAGEVGGGGISENAKILFAALSNGYVYDSAPNDTETKYPFKRGSDNVYAMVTGQNPVVLGEDFIYTGSIPPQNPGELYSGDAGYKKGNVIVKDTATTILGSERTSLSTDTLVRGDDGCRYLKVSYASMPSNSDVYLAVGENGKFDKLTKQNSEYLSDNDDILVWTPKGVNVGSQADRLVEKDGSAATKEFSADGYDWTVFESSSETGRSIVVSKGLLYSGIGSASLSAYLPMLADGAGGGVLSQLVAADNTAVAILLTKAEASAYFNSDEQRICQNSNNAQGEAGAAWWLKDNWWVLADGSIATAQNAGACGLRGVLSVDTQRLNDYITATP